MKLQGLYKKLLYSYIDAAFKIVACIDFMILLTKSSWPCTKIYQEIAHKGTQEPYQCIVCEAQKVHFFIGEIPRSTHQSVMS